VQKLVIINRPDLEECRYVPAFGHFTRSFM
jgi:hypothetical protein